MNKDISLDERERQMAEKAWDEGFRSGHSLAMRRMSDEPDATGNPNPYREENNERA